MPVCIRGADRLRHGPVPRFTKQTQAFKMNALSTCLLVLLAASLSAAQLRNCPPLWSGSGEKCYQFFKEALPWQDASDYCARFSSCATGASSTLVTIPSAEVDRRLERFLGPKGNPNPPNIWMALGDPLGSGALAWPGGITPQTAGYSNFDQAGRNGNCVLKDTRTNQWAFAPCTQANSFVCEIDRNPPQPPSTPGAGFPGGPV
ncbi:ovocleidin-17-like [Acanthaster planci]|uniref:Ovocleidin-17-like n=1 Tax=Acanthaster planci TaxID=133434 RepID=A0A8B7Z165_ACAPL|nr:ovocleidin-17-like [Acanthaster planci]